MLCPQRGRPHPGQRADGRGLLNNYAHISFNVGPTLLKWLQRHAPEVAEGIREGDRISREQHDGHGNALAQPYNHTILPLDREADRRTQVRWGIHVFRSFFGRDPEGMWLPEAAVDLSTLETIAREGIRFTILAPHQAQRIRRRGSTAWTNVLHDLDTTRPYLCRLPSGGEIVIFFYDGSITRGVAFEGLLNDGENLYRRILGAFRPDRSEAQMVHIATDGESVRSSPSLRRDGPGVRPPSGRPRPIGSPHESWGVPGAPPAHLGSGGPRAHVLELCPRGGTVAGRLRLPLGREPGPGTSGGEDRCGTHWSASRTGWTPSSRNTEADCSGIRGPREDYIRVIERGTSANHPSFWETHRRPGCEDTDLPRAVRLLEMQRHGLLMFTSCGWFFDEISGLEATQILRYAARAIQLAESFGHRLEPDFVQALERAQSNLPDLAHGRGVWERFVRPDSATLDRVVAHYAIRSLFRERRNVEDLHCYHIHDLHKHVETLGTTQVALGRVRVRSTVALDELDALFGVVHFGGLDFSCFQRMATPSDDVRALQERIVETYRTRSVGEAYALMREEFPAPIYHLKDLFLDEQRHIIHVVLDERFQDYLHTMEVLAEKDLGILNHLATLGYPIPAPLVMASTVHVNRRIEQILQELPEDGNALGEADDLLHRSLAWGYRPDRELWARSLQGRMEEALDGLAAGADSPEDVFPLCRRILDASERLQIPLNLWRTQNRFVNACWNAWMGWTERLQDAETLAKRLSLRETLLPWNRPLESA